MSDLAYPDLRIPADPAWVLLDFALEYFGPDAGGKVTQANRGTKVPATGLSTRLPFIHAFHWDGDSDRFGTRPIVDLSTFAGTYSESRLTALGIETKLLGYPFRVNSGGRSVLVDRVEAVSPAVEVEWQQDSSIRRFQGTYQLSLRR